jgi:hypothetical protein
MGPGGRNCPITDKLVSAKCGKKALPNGNYPCIPNLPEVRGACCGHGQGWGYLWFENGTLITEGYAANPTVNFANS